jgi:predicted dehydrogenase
MEHAMRRSPPSTPASATRREFLGSAGLVAGAAVAAPYVITSTALGTPTRPPASDRIVIGGIGLGNMGRADQGNFLKRPDVQYVAVCEVQEKAADRGKADVDSRNGNRDCAVYRDFRDLLARADVDAVHIGTPDHWHAIMTIAACVAGKDVYLQKPETLTLREGPLMVAAARRYGRVVSGGSQRVLGDYRFFTDPCWAGELGGITSVDIEVGPPAQPCYLAAAPTPPGLDWDMWLGPAPWQPFNPGRISGGYGTTGDTWRSYVDYSGGALTDWGAHHFGGAIFACDLREEQPVKVSWHPPSADGKAAAHASVTYRNGTQIFHGRPASLGPADGPLVLRQKAIVIAGDGRPSPPKPLPAYRGDGGIYGDFIHCVRTRERPFRDIELAVNTMAAVHMIAIAHRLQRSLEWDRPSQRFVDDDEANRMLDRARREPWIL